MSVTAIPSAPAQTITAPTTKRVRDNFIDVLRIFAIALVVLQHWLMPVLDFDSGQISTGNALSSPGAWIITWISQVMPLVFFAGGAANAISWRSNARRGETGTGWLAGRLRRLAWPVLPLAAVWIPLPHLLLALGLPSQPVETASHLAGQLLWFLAAYLIAVVLTPIMIRLHERFGLRVLAVLAPAAILTDVIRFSWIEQAGWANLIFVWLAVHQLGFSYQDGALSTLAGRRAAAMSAAGFAATAALVAFGPYPGSMIGMPGAETSNMAPPTLCVLTVAIGQLGLAMLLRPVIMRLSEVRPISKVLHWAAPKMMTIYLWHMTALATVAGVVVIAFDVATPDPGSTAWLVGAPFWLLVLGAVLSVLLRFFARFEQPPAASSARMSVGRVMLSASLIGGALLTLTINGFRPPDETELASALVSAPVLAAMALVAGLALTQGRKMRGTPDNDRGLGKNHQPWNASVPFLPATSPSPGSSLETV